MFRKYLWVIGIFCFLSPHTKNCGSTNDSRFKMNWGRLLRHSPNTLQKQTTFNTSVNDVCSTGSKARLQFIIPFLSNVLLKCLCFKVTLNKTVAACFILVSHLTSWSWCFPPKRRLTLTELNGAISYKIKQFQYESFWSVSVHVLTLTKVSEILRYLEQDCFS